MRAIRSAARSLRWEDSRQAPGRVLRWVEVGLRVRRGPDWSWDNQDQGGLGTTIEAAEDGWIRVKWDHGLRGKYRIGGGRYDLVVDEQKVVNSRTYGLRVRRGPDWMWNDQDQNGLGTTVEGYNGCNAEGWIIVKWDHGGCNGYRIGRDQCYDLIVVEEPSWRPAGTLVSTSAADSIQVGSRIKFVQMSEDVDFTGCPGLCLSFGHQYLFARVGEIRGSWFRPTEYLDLWAPLSAVRAVRLAAEGESEETADSEATASEGSRPSEADFGGYDEEWLDVARANATQCSICLHVPRDALVHDCGELFCDSCWTRWMAENDTCPTCRGDAIALYPAPRERREILNFKLRCPNRCGAELRLGDKADHCENQCPKRKVKCPHCKERVAFEALASQAEGCAAGTSCKVCREMVPIDQMDHLQERAGKNFVVQHLLMLALKTRMAKAHHYCDQMASTASTADTAAASSSQSDGE